MTRLIGKNGVETKLSENLSRKHPVFPVSLIKTYQQAGEDKFNSRIKAHITQDMVGVEESPGAVRKILKARKIRLNGNDHMQYLVIFKNQKSNKGKWLAEDPIQESTFT
ncbi:hypothetical protein O181_007380 [Austropuccinia psidii MF-1]|uniref:Uncharacterized protein n=1 Tax=Austropuccinia psidii MF-1 TaxID=1389203 RepID=A0A9Q3GHT4_9BASI|nr:hypothetical protein [Austropuccinia psidii MF-1]